MDETGLIKKNETETKTLVLSVDYKKEIERIKEQKQAMDTLIKDVLQKDVHYGLIPGCGQKPSLLKPGAEVLIKLFKLTSDIKTTEELLDRGHIKYTSIAYLFYNGEQVGSASGSCSTLETKYAMVYGKPRENIADVYNTCRKMSEKRSLVAVTLITTGASDKFTQDIEEMTETADTEENANDKPKAEQPTVKTPLVVTEVAARRKALYDKVVAEFDKQTSEMNKTDKENCRIATCKVVWPNIKYFKAFEWFTDIDLEAFYKQLLEGK